MLRLMTVLAIFTPAIALATDDPLKAELDKARSKHADGLEAAKTKFVAAMEAKLKDVAGKGDLDGATQIKAQREQFEKEGTIPKTLLLTRARTDYEAEVKAAGDSLRRALEKAKDGYTKALKLDEAQAVAAELKSLAGAPKPPAASPDDLSAKFAEGSVWKGVNKEKRGGAEFTWDIVVTVTKRKGATFEGTYDVKDGKFVYLIEGSIQKEQVTFKVTKIEKQPKDGDIKNLIGVEFKGGIKLDPKTKKPTLVTNYTWRNVNNTGVNAQGTATLVLE